MCKICEWICKKISEVYGHDVDPEALALLIEESPLTKVKHCPKPKKEKIELAD